MILDKWVKHCASLYTGVGPGKHGQTVQGDGLCVDCARAYADQRVTEALEKAAGGVTFDADALEATLTTEAEKQIWCPLVKALRSRAVAIRALQKELVK